MLARLRVCSKRVRCLVPVAVELLFRCYRFQDLRVTRLYQPNLEGTHQRFVNAHHGSRVVKLPTVVGSRKNSHQMSVCEKLISILHHLMTSTDQIQILVLQKRVNNVFRKDVTDASIIQTPSRREFILRVRPQDIAQKTVVRHHCGPFDLGQFGYGGQFGTQSSMHADNPVVDQRGHWHTLEAIRKGSPETDAIATFALVVEAIDLVNVVGFMIASKEKEIVRIFYFVRKKETNALNALFPPIHVIATGESYPKKIPQK